MTPEERMESDATSLVDLYARVFTKLKKQCTGFPEAKLMDIATELTVAEIRKERSAR